jgi:hypothetical protein
MPTGVYKRKKHKIICHPEIKRHVRGYCINCYSRVLSQENPQYKINQEKYKKDRYKKLGSKMINKNNVSNQREWRVKAIVKLGGKCCKCGFSDIRALQLDHIYGGGHKERSTRKSDAKKIATDVYGKEKFQLLCANCNWIKRWENKEGCREDYNSYLLEVNKRINNEKK